MQLASWLCLKLDAFSARKRGSNETYCSGTKTLKTIVRSGCAKSINLHPSPAMPALLIHLLLWALLPSPLGCFSLALGLLRRRT
jgi:hypothetical protein